MALTPTPHTNYYAHYSPRTLMYPSLPHVDVHISAHHLNTLGILWCISSTLQFTFNLINNLQIHHVRVQHCTLLFRSLRSVFLLWTKIFTTPALVFQTWLVSMLSKSRFRWTGLFWFIDEFNDTFELGTLAEDIIRSWVNGFRLKPYHCTIPPNPFAKKHHNTDQPTTDTMEDAMWQSRKPHYLTPEIV